MKKNKTLLYAVCALLFLISAGTAKAAQEVDLLRLGLVRNFGYGGIGKIQGNFTLTIVNPPSDLEEVVFYMDGERLGVVKSPPFQVKFHTADFLPGKHQMSATGRLADGSLLTANSLTKTFLSSDDAWSETQGIILPLLGGTAVLTLLGLGVPMLIGRKKEFSLGVYGSGGGTVCPRCGLPFSRPVMAPNLLTGKLVRCPHCGKVAVLPRVSSLILEEAESRYASVENPTSSRKTEDDLRKMLDESRFES